MDAREVGLDATLLERVAEVIGEDVGAERYDGAVVLVARHGQVALFDIGRVARVLS